MKVEIRKATKDDCMDLAKLVTIVWNETYKGIVDESFLQRLYKNERARGIESTKKFDNKERHKYVLLVNDELSGFINVGKCDKTGFPGYGEVYALYILKKYQGKGIGKMLLNIGKKELKDMGYNKFVIGCLKGNPSNDFYIHQGGKYETTLMFEKLHIPENVYSFDNN